MERVPERCDSQACWPKRCDSLDCWLAGLRRRFGGFEEEITKNAGLSPGFGYLDAYVIERILETLLRKDEA